MNSLCVITLAAMIVMSVGANPVDDKQVCISQFRSALDKQFVMPADVESFIKSVKVDWVTVLAGELDTSVFLDAAKKVGRPDAGCQQFQEFTADEDLEEAIDCFEQNDLLLDAATMGEGKIRSFWQGIVACGASQPDLDD